MCFIQEQAVTAVLTVGISFLGSSTYCSLYGKKNASIRSNHWNLKGKHNTGRCTSVTRNVCSCWYKLLSITLVEVLLSVYYWCILITRKISVIVFLTISRQCHSWVSFSNNIRLLVLKVSIQKQLLAPRRVAGCSWEGRAGGRNFGCSLKPFHSYSK